jgi:amino acid transporter
LGATASQPQVRLDAEGLDRGLGFWGLLWSSEGSIIGSGWLFGALTVTTLAGPSGIIGWIIATAIVIVLALIHAELGGLFPVTGGTSRFPHYAFGSLAGGAFGWMSYLQAASVAPIEVLATIQYFSSYSWASSWYNASNGTLHGLGWVIAIGLQFLFTALNLIGIRWFARINNTITTWKVAIPVLTIIVLLFKFHGSNFSAAGGFFEKTGAIKSILLAIPGGGIVFSLLGFEQAVQLGGEARNPKDIPKAVIASILIGGTIYILVQIMFIAALQPSLLAHAGSWANLGPTSHNTTIQLINRAPFYEVAKLAGLGLLAIFLRVDAVISPSGTGLIYLTSASRISYGLSKNGYVPSIFEDVSENSKVPWFSVIFAAVIGLLFLLPFPSWGKLVGIVTSASVLMYAAAPLSLGALRLTKPNLERPYKLPAAHVMAPLAFVCANFIVYWAGWQTYTTLIVAMLIGFALYWLSAVFKLNPNKPKWDMGAAPWLLGYVIGMLLISYFGDFGPGGIIGGIGVFKTVLDQGGNDDLGLWGGLIASAVWSLVIYYWAINSRLSEAQVDEYVSEVYPTVDTAH